MVSSHSGLGPHMSIAKFTYLFPESKFPKTLLRKADEGGWFVAKGTLASNDSMLSLKIYMIKSTLEGFICFLGHPEVWRVGRPSGKVDTICQKRFEYFRELKDPEKLVALYKFTWADALNFSMSGNCQDLHCPYTQTLCYEV